MTRCAGLTIAAAAALCACATTAAAQQTPAALQLAMDRPVELSVQEATITEVFNRLSAASGVKFLVTEDALEHLPYGEQTCLSVTLKNVTLRKALTPMLAPQALRWEIKDDLVQIVPVEPLYRLGRRATLDELKLLGIIHSKELLPTAEAGAAIEQLRKAAGDPKLDVIFHVAADKAAALAKADRFLPATAAAWLDMLCHGEGWTWYAASGHIIILDKKAQLSRQLQRQVSLRYQNANLAAVLHDLALKARARLVMEAGVMNYLPAEARTNFGLVMADATIDQALQVISGETGLKFVPGDEGILVEASEKLKEGLQAARAGGRSPFFIRMSLPGPDNASTEIFFRADELPDELLEAIRAEKEKLVRMLYERYLPGRPQPAASSGQ